MTERERRDRGLLYRADADLVQEMLNARRLVAALNCAVTFQEIRDAVETLFPEAEDAMILPPFHCDYGSNIRLGKNFFANVGCVILDVGKVTIGDNVLFGPHVSVYTAGHPLHPDVRNSGYEYGLPVTIGENVWVGGNVTILPGVTVGDCAVIAAGAVVTKDVPAWTVVGGNPAKVLRQITEEDRYCACKGQAIDEEARNILTEMGVLPEK